MLLEVCVENVESATNACNGGARRLEVCSSLELGGLTPSLGFFKVLKKTVPSDCQLFVMIRSRPGNFFYNSIELKIMLKDIKIFKEHKADGFVFGCLSKQYSIDEKACKQLLKAADGFPCTFHRAFDIVRDPEESLELLSKLGFRRILTSGQKDTAYKGKDAIKVFNQKVKEMGSQLIIMPGGGIKPVNVKEILETTKCIEFHSSARDDSSRAEEKEVGWMSKTSVVKDMILKANSCKL